MRTAVVCSAFYAFHGPLFNATRGPGRSVSRDRRARRILQKGGSCDDAPFHLPHLLYQVATTMHRGKMDRSFGHDLLNTNPLHMLGTAEVPVDVTLCNTVETCPALR